MEPLDTEPARRVQGGCSVGRIVNLLVGFLFLLIMITALVVVGVMGSLDLVLSKQRPVNTSDSCPIFVWFNSGGLHFGNNSVCYFVEAAYGLIAFFCLVYFVIQVVRGIFQFDLWFTAMVDMAAVLLNVVLCFSTAITVSVGLSITCTSVAANTPDNPNCDVMLPGGTPSTGNEGSFYSYVNAAQGAAWVCMLFLVIAFVVTILRVVVFVKRRKAGTPIDMDGTLLSDDFDDKPES